MHACTARKSRHNNHRVINEQFFIFSLNFRHDKHVFY